MAMLDNRGVRKATCAECRRPRPIYEIVNLGSNDPKYRQLCAECFNREAAEDMGLDDFLHVEFQPVDLADGAGVVHRFHFLSLMTPASLTLEAFELRNGEVTGYRFKVAGEPGQDPRRLFEQLVEKVKRGIAYRHLAKEHFGAAIAEAGIVRGRIEVSESDSAVPALVIDGRTVWWEDFGRMLAAHEGSQFRIELRDLSDEV